jgi:hypothetical protein
MYLIHAQHPRPCTKCHTRIARGTLAYYPPLICTACHDALTEDERDALRDRQREIARSLYTSNGASDCLYDR